MLNLVHLHSYQEIDVTLVPAQSIRIPRAGTQAFIGALDLGNEPAWPHSALWGLFSKIYFSIWEPGPVRAVKVIPWSTLSRKQVATDLRDLCLWGHHDTVAKHSSRRVTWAPYIQVRPSKLLIPGLGQPLIFIKQKACLRLWSINCWHGPSFESHIWALHDSCHSCSDYPGP